MSRNLGFVRKFVILKREFSNMKGLNPKGHGKLELRNNKLNISLNIENGEKDNFYNVILLTGKEVYDLGKIFTDNNYLGKADFNLNYKDLESEGFPIGRINSILLVRGSKVFLGGYFNKSDNTIEDYIEKLESMGIEKKTKGKEEKIKRKSEKEKPEAKKPFSNKGKEKELVRDKTKGPNLKKEEELTKEKDDKKVDEEEGTKEKDDGEKSEEKSKRIDNKEVDEEKENEENEYKEIIKDKVDDKEVEITKSPITSEINTKEKYDKIMSNIFDKEIDKGKEEEENKQRMETTDYVLDILSFFPYIEPFRINLQGYNWWKIDITDSENEKGFLPYFSYVVGGNHKYSIIKDSVSSSSLIKKYRHYIFGLYNINNEVKFYVYGVPGRFLKEEHPQRGNTGFNTWFEGRENYGYWLLYIDPIGGRIIHPVNPMIPIE